MDFFDENKPPPPVAHTEMAGRGHFRMLQESRKILVGFPMSVGVSYGKQ
jgi:hypothetical protein